MLCSNKNAKNKIEHMNWTDKYAALIYRIYLVTRLIGCHDVGCSCAVVLTKERKGNEILKNTRLENSKYVAIIYRTGPS